MCRVGPRDEGFAAFTVPPVVTLRTVGGIPLYLRSTLEIDYGDHPDFDGERKVNTFSYAHTVGRSDSLKPQFYSWEWAAVEPMYPHVHVRMKDPDYHGLGKLHIPTGRVFFEEILLFPLAEHQVAPQRTIRRLYSRNRYGACRCGRVGAADSDLTEHRDLLASPLVREKSAK